MAKKFGFAHLLGLGKPAEAKAEEESEEAKNAETHQGDEDGESEKDEAKKGKSKGDGKSDDDSESDDADDAEDDGEDDDSDEDKSARAARLAERRRCASIFAAPEAAGRIGMAAELAFNTDLSAAQAIGVLKASPAEAAAQPGGLAAAMTSFGNPAIGTDAKGASGSGDHGWDAAVAKAETLTGRKPRK